MSESYFDGLGSADHASSDGPGGTTIVTETTFDVRGQVAAKSAPHVSTESPIFTQFSYDTIGRQVQVTNPDGTVGTTSYLKDKITQTDPNGNVKRKFLDAYGRQKRVEEVDGTQTYATTYEYNAIDALTKVTNHLGHVTTMTYDLMGRKTAMSDPNMGNWSYVYDKAGNLTRQTDAKGQILNFTYDLQSRTTTKTYPDTRQIVWTYDVSDLPDENYSKGRLTRVVDLAGETRFVYDKLGRVTKSERNIDGTPHVMTQQYNALGKMTSETFPDGDSVSYSYDTGFLNKIFDAAGDYVSSISYNARGQKKTIQYGNGVTSNFIYNDTGAAPDFRPANRTTSGAGGNFQNLTYDYDNVGNITSIADSLFTAGRTFTYDALNRLRTGSGPFGALVGGIPDQASCTYTYDAIGNILKKCGVTYSYNDLLHPSFVTSTSDGKTYTADVNGNTLTGAGRSFVWTPDNRVDSVTMGGTTTMDYDYTGIRVKKSGPLGLTIYPFAGYEIGPDGTKTKYFKVGNEMLAAKQTPTADPEKKLFYHNDHLGGVNVITDISGNKVQLTEYDPWGKVSRTEGNVEPERRFTGQILDPESGLYYYGGRYYDAELARFVSPDFLVPEPGDPQSLNRYSYVLNNPQKYIDPTGHSFWDIFKHIVNFVRVVVAVIMLPVNPAYSFLEFASVMSSYMPGKNAAMASMVTGYMAAASLVGQGLLESGVPDPGGVDLTVESRQPSVAMCFTGPPCGSVQLGAGALSYVQAPGLKCGTSSCVDVLPMPTPLSIGGIAEGGVGFFSKAASFLGRVFGFSREETINIGEGAIDHVLKRHGFGSLATNASKFLEGENIPGLIRAAESIAPGAQSFGNNFQRIVNVGREIGIDFTTGKPTSWYTVITDKAGKLVTVFPGPPIR